MCGMTPSESGPGAGAGHPHIMLIMLAKPKAGDEKREVKREKTERKDKTRESKR